MESILETKALTLVQFLQGLRGELHVNLEEGTCGLAVRCAQAPGARSCGLQPAAECPAEGG